MAPVSWSFTTHGQHLQLPVHDLAEHRDARRAPTPTPARSSSGVKFRASASGFVTGIRYYKPTRRTGTHVGTLWTATGTRLGTVTFTNESASGWQQATFASPIPVTASTTYVASYFTPVATPSTAATSPAQPRPAARSPRSQNGTDGGNGVYRYSSTAGSFPNSTYNSENYWVDVVFAETAQDDLPPTVTGRSPAAGATGVPVGIRPSASFSEPVTGCVGRRWSCATRPTRWSPATTATTPAPSPRRSPRRPTSPTRRATPSTSAGPATPAGTRWRRSRWSFQTSAPPPPGIDDGPGGPIAVVTSSGNPSSSYLAEILRAEGLNEFANLKVAVADGREPRAVLHGRAGRRPAQRRPGRRADRLGQRRRQPGR